MLMNVPKDSKNTRKSGKNRAVFALYKWDEIEKNWTKFRKNVGQNMPLKTPIKTTKKIAKK